MSGKLVKYLPQDYDRVVSFFRDLYRESETIPHWLPQRWEYAEYLVSPLHKGRGVDVDWKESIYFWKNAEEDIVALLLSEYPNERITIHTKPGYRDIEEKMIDHAEEHVIPEVIHTSEIKIWCRDGDTFRENLLVKKGYAKINEVEYLNWIDLGEEIPEFDIPEGYILRDMVDESGLDLQKKINRITSAFNSEPYDIEIYRNFQRCPSYRNEYDLYTTDDDGEICSFCFIWYDAELNIAYFEPVGTDKEHRRKGLGRATINAGLKRLRKDGVARAFVGAAGEERGAFYTASGFSDRLSYYPWQKRLKK